MTKQFASLIERKIPAPWLPVGLTLGRPSGPRPVRVVGAGRARRRRRRRHHRRRLRPLGPQPTRQRDRRDLLRHPHGPQPNRVRPQRPAVDRHRHERHRQR